VSSTNFTPNTGFTSAVTLCNTAAGSKSWGGSFVPWMSSSFFTPATHFVDGGVYMRPDKVIVATSRADLMDGFLAASIGVDENQATVTAGTEVWTGTSDTGTIATSQTCADWNSSSNSGVVGQVSTGSWSWSRVGVQCNTPMRVYCFEN